MKNLIKKILKESEWFGMIFRVGNRVRLSPNSQFMDDGPQNPSSEYEVGTIIETHPNNAFCYRVRWDAGYTNFYKRNDLLPLFDYDETNDLFNKINESEWYEDVINSIPNPYQMEGQEFIDFMNKYFQSNPSPNLNRKYKITEDNRGLALKDYTGVYFHMDEETMDEVVYHIEEYLSRPSSGKRKNITEEFEDLYSTIKPLIDTYK